MLTVRLACRICICDVCDCDCVSFPWLEFSGLVLQAAERLFNFVLCLCAWAWARGQAALPPPLPEDAKILGSVDVFFGVLYNILCTY